MLILGIETSCDETAGAVVEDGRLVRSNVVASQLPLHERFGGVVPEIASRQHLLAITGVTRRALELAECRIDDLDAIAVTLGPGLSGALLVGTTFAKGLSLGTGLPLLAVNHIEAHVLSVWLEQPAPDLPLVSLVVSGGHTELFLVRRPGVYRRLGGTLDDAAGEAFDKVGRLLGLPYPGGPSMELAAARFRSEEPRKVLPRAWLPGTHDFSFSGIKTAMVREVRALVAKGGCLDTHTTAGLALAFQESVADVLTRKLIDAAVECGARSAAIVGGVANNRFIRRLAEERLPHGLALRFPGPGLSSDNAAMIAGAAFWNPAEAGMELDACPSLAV